MTQLTKKQFIADLKIKDLVESVFLVRSITVLEAKDGKPYINIQIGDATGDMDSRIWYDVDQIIERVSAGMFVKISGRLNLYQGKKQLIINQIEAIDSEKLESMGLQLNDFVMTSALSADVMYDELLTIVERLDDVYIRELLLDIIHEPEISRRLKIWQAGKTVHHAYQSGLLEHILSCANLAVSLSAFYKVNKNYVVAGAILHDICKIYELSSGLSVEYTEEGKLVGHLSKGLEIIDRYASKIKNFPYPIKMHLKHIVISHHGEYEYGSPKLPSTSEAMLVHLIDFMDSKMNAFEGVKKSDNNPGHWSLFVKHLDRIIFKTELPTYKEFAEIESVGKVEEPVVEKPASKKEHGKEIKQNLGKYLEGFKVKDK